MFFKSNCLNFNLGTLTRFLPEVRDRKLATIACALVAAVALILLLTGRVDAAPGKRVALVIGNTAYRHVTPLANPIKDATAIARMFKELGFNSVTLRQDVGAQDFKRALREFSDAAQDADIAVVYFAGHGIQVGDMSYLIPVDAPLATEIDVQDEAVSLDRVLLALQPARRLRLVILDSCRENPFLNRPRLPQTARSITRGLARVEPENNSLVAYAAKNGQVAQDGTGDHSPFTAALLKHLPVPGLDIRLALGRVRDDVLKSTSNTQEPFVYGSLGGESISLAPASAVATPAVSGAAKSDYALAERVGTQQAWEAFLATHKEGLYADLAKTQLAKVLEAARKPAGSGQAGTAQTAVLAPLATAAQPKPATLPSKDRADWERIKDSGDPAQLRDFITKYPSSPFTGPARDRLQVLDRTARERDERRAEQQAAARLEGQRIATAPDDSESCRRDKQKLDLLRANTTQGWAREDLRRLERTTPCDRVRTEAVALLGGAPDTSQRTGAAQPQPLNMLGPALSAIAELRRLGCVAGQNDAVVNETLRNAVRSYLSEKGRSADDIKLVESLLADLKTENKRLCADTAQGQ
jgi:uncharacterized caspase-like protein